MKVFRNQANLIPMVHSTSACVHEPTDLPWLYPGAHNDVRAEGKGRNVQRPRKIWKRSHGIPVAIFSCTRT